MSKFAALALEVEKPRRMVIVHPGTGQPLRDKEGAEAYVEIYSPDSDLARKHQHAAMSRRMSVRGRGKVEPQDIEDEQIAFLAALTAGWHLMSLAGEELNVPFSLENARELYAEPAVAWLREQVDQFAADRANFAKA